MRKIFSQPRVEPLRCFFCSEEIRFIVQFSHGEIKCLHCFSGRLAGLKVDFGSDSLCERTEQLVVILRGNWIILVIMASGASNRGCKHGGSHRCNHIIGRIESNTLSLAQGYLGRINTCPQKSGCSERLGIVGIQFVACDLPLNKSIVGHVRVQGSNHKVAEMKCVFAIVVMLETVALCESRDIQPVPGPAFAVARAIEESCDKLFVCFRVLVIDKGGNFFGSRGKTYEIQIGSTDQFFGSNWAGCFEPLFIMACKQVAIDRGLLLMVLGGRRTQFQGSISPIAPVLRRHLHRCFPGRTFFQ